MGRSELMCAVGSAEARNQLMFPNFGLVIHDLKYRSFTTGLEVHHNIAYWHQYAASKAAR